MAAVVRSQESAALVSDFTAVKPLSLESLKAPVSRPLLRRVATTPTLMTAASRLFGTWPRFLADAKSDGSVRDPSVRTMMHCEGN